MFKPSASLRGRIAPTQYEHGASGPVLWGVVHDPTSRFMGGVAGHAGLFSTADDLSIFAQMLLDGGTYNGARILSPLSIEKMTEPETPPNKMVLRGLGWDIDSPFASNRGELFDVGSFGHTGYTGTSIWIDPVTKTYVILLTNRVHPNNKGEVAGLRTALATLVAGALGPLSAQQILDSRRSLTSYFELMKSYRVQGLRNGSVKTGIDVLEAEHFAALAGEARGVDHQRVGPRERWPTHHRLAGPCSGREAGGAVQPRARAGRRGSGRRQGGFLPRRLHRPARLQPVWRRAAAQRPDARRHRRAGF